MLFHQLYEELPYDRKVVEVCGCLINKPYGYMISASMQFLYEYLGIHIE